VNSDSCIGNIFKVGVGNRKELAERYYL